MSNFNLENYETVKERKKRFYADHPDGSLVVEHIQIDADMAIMKCRAYRTKEEQEKMLPTATGYAQEFQGKGGFANKHAWLENCEESAVGRCLDNAGYSGNDKCSREEVQKVQTSEDDWKRCQQNINDLIGKKKLTPEIKASIPDMHKWNYKQCLAAEKILQGLPNV
jgi:hypothetical protein